ncbi:uncharacterized protein LOC119728501 [Patiria miniata]|uniref:SnoaL-like domain-containing protein n=1 Tax=Patiria miniata TaxID=46514 RepID=A0A914A040_PATMI|nr:uncharacterized protein LOC119728501 [Patiria miniata]
MSAWTSLVVLLVACALVPCHDARSIAYLQQGLQKIRAQNAKYMDAVAANNIDAILELYTDNCLYMPQNHPATIGKEGMRSHLGWVAYAEKIEYEIQYLDYLNTNTGEALEWKTITVYAKTGDVLFEGKTLIIWTFDSATNNFKVGLEMYNSNGKQ